jgi:elongation factor 3
MTRFSQIEGPQAFVHLGLADAIEKALNDKKNPIAREGAAQLIKTLAQQGVGNAVEPFIYEKVLSLLVADAFADKIVSVRTAAVEAVIALVKVQSPWATCLLLPLLLKEVSTTGKWQVKLGGLQVLDQLVASAPAQIATSMPLLVPVLADLIHDTKADVKKAARATLTQSTQLISNKDIEKFIPALIQCLIKPEEEVPKTIQLLAATTFVSEVDSPTLSLMAPLLARGLNERLTATRRKVAVIIDNSACFEAERQVLSLTLTPLVSKLVDDEYTIRPFVPKILPGLIKLEEQVADPEARGVVTKAIKTVQEVAKVEGDGSNAPPPRVQDPKAIATNLIAAIKKFFPSTHLTATSPLAVYISQLASALIDARNFELTEWETALVPYVSLGIPEAQKANGVVKDLLERSAKTAGGSAEILEDEEEGEDLCNCTFSLAYGAKILLNTATLRLKRGHRYGLCGRNGSGKSTLMRAIHNGQVEGFPSPDEVRTFYVEHDIDGSEAETTVLAWILADKRINANEQECRDTLNQLGFSAVRQDEPIGGLSGGWKMKLALARAMLFKADILLLDEPTNHLDVVNVAWLQDYLTSLTTCTSIIVSHDSGFLNNVCTDILHLNRFKVRRYRGNLEAFVKAVPEAKAYYELNAAEEYQFKLPNRKSSACIELLTNL